VSYYKATAYSPSGTETWKCNQCGTQLIGVRVPRRSALPKKRGGLSVDYDIQSKCPKCGNVLCGKCIEFQKPNEKFPSSEVLCPECGTKFDDGAVLVPTQWAENIDKAGIGLEATSYVKDLRNWAGWLVFWTIVNFFGTVALLSGGPDSEVGVGMPEPLAYLSLFVDIMVFISAIACLASRVPWHGFYIVFSIYLIMIGISNLIGPASFWTGLGIFQIILAVKLIGNSSKYSTSRTDTW